MNSNIESVGIDKIFGVKHYNVKIVKSNKNIFRYIVSVISYAVFIFLMIIGGILVVYIADIKIRAAKGDYTPPKYNAYVVLSRSMYPAIEVDDIVVTKKIDEDELNINDVITFMSPDSRFSGISITHRIIDKEYDETLGEYTYRTKGDYNNVADSVLVPYNNIIGKVVMKIPKLGYLQKVLMSKVGMIVLILIPCLTILSYDIMKVLRNIGKGLNFLKK